MPLNEIINASHQLVNKEDFFYNISHTLDLEFNPTDLKNAQDYLRDLGCPDGILETLFDKNGQWQYESPIDLSNLDDLSFVELNELLQKAYEQIYIAVTLSLDSISKYGFNSHDEAHIDKVTEETIRLLQRREYPIEAEKNKTIKNGIIAARSHDIGNLFSRKVHSIISYLMVEKIFPSLTSDKDNYRRIMQAIGLHDEHITESVLNSHTIGDAQEIIQVMKDFFPAEALALLVADKIQIGRERISSKSRSRGAIDRDKHVEVNFFGQTKGLVFSPEKDTMTWTLEFNDSVNLEERELYSEMTTETDDSKAYTSHDTNARLKNEGISYFSTWQNNFWQLYTNRVKLTIEAAFALYSELKEFRIEMVDLSKQEERKSAKKMFYTFTRPQ